MAKVHKTFEFKTLEHRKDGGRIVISTPSVDRDRDRVIPSGAQIDNYMRNPVVQYGHNYSEPWATIGRTTSLQVSPEGITAEFELRPAANESDPQNIVRLLWEGGWIRTASVGFIPSSARPNAEGGLDFNEWQLLEWSLVPIPANQDAMRLAMKAMDNKPEGVIAKADAAYQRTRAWIRRSTFDSGSGNQTVFTCAYSRSVDVPEDATTLHINESGECEEIPDPNAGKTIQITSIDFVPPVEFVDDEGYSDAAYGCSGAATESELLGMWDEEFKIVELGDVISEIEFSKGFKKGAGGKFDINKLTRRAVNRAKGLALQRNKRIQAAINKRGRVLSSANETELRAAVDEVESGTARIKGVLSKVESPEPEQEGASVVVQLDAGADTGVNADADVEAIAAEAKAKELQAEQDALLEIVSLLGEANREIGKLRF